MKRYYLAIDIGASSGRHILGHMEDGKMVLEEIYRFPNGMQKRDGEKVWDIEALFEAVLAALMAGVIPFIPGDLIKMVLAMILGPQIRNRLIHANLF